MVNDLALALAGALETPRYVATIADYRAWSKAIGPHRFQSLLDAGETERQEALAEADVNILDVLSRPGPLMRAWSDHCLAQGWDDHAFDEGATGCRGRLWAAIMREEAGPEPWPPGLE